MSLNHFLNWQLIYVCPSHFVYQSQWVLLFVFHLFFFLDIFFINISNIMPFLSFPPGKPPPYPISPASMRVLPQPPTHSLPPPLPSISYTGASSLHRTKGLTSPWWPTRPSSATYEAHVLLWAGLKLTWTRYHWMVGGAERQKLGGREK